MKHILLASCLFINSSLYAAPVPASSLPIPVLADSSSQNTAQAGGAAPAGAAAGALVGLAAYGLYRIFH